MRLLFVACLLVTFLSAGCVTSSTGTTSQSSTTSSPVAPSQAADCKIPNDAASTSVTLGTDGIYQDGANAWRETNGVSGLQKQGYCGKAADMQLA